MYSLISIDPNYGVIFILKDVLNCLSNQTMEYLASMPNICQVDYRFVRKQQSLRLSLKHGHSYLECCKLKEMCFF